MAVRNSEQFSELEFCIDRYFNANIAPVMDSTQSYLSSKCAEEIGEYSNSFAGMVRSMNDDMHGAGDTSLLHLKVAGKWNSKTTDDYLDMVRKNIAEDKDIQKDMVVLANEWRKAVISEVCRDAYDAASRQIGADLSYAYIEYRMEQLMINRLANKRTPQSTMEYVMRKAAEGSLFGLPILLTKSATDFWIDEMVEERYKPTTFEKGAANVTTFGIDAVSMGGIASWGALAKMAGAEVVLSGAETLLTTGKNGDKGISVDECISRGLFNSQQNVFNEIRRMSHISRTWEHPGIIAINNGLTKKLKILDTKPLYADFLFDESKPVLDFTKGKNRFSLDFGKNKPEPDREDIPMVVAPGEEESYREFLSQLEAEKQKQAEPSAVGSEQDDESVPKVQENDDAEEADNDLAASSATYQKQTDATETNLSGWDSLISTFSLNDLSAVGSNLGYVIAMLPDVLLGAFTGKSKSLRLEDNLLPIASVIAGLFIKNPLLKMTLIGLGGANLLNKAGHEALGRPVQEVLPVQSVRYKQYADEPLDQRIAGLQIQGNMLICTIDRVPSTISLPKAVVEAYDAGALPLNTLANAVLARHDAMQENLRQQYEDTAREQNYNQGIR